MPLEFLPTSHTHEFPRTPRPVAVRGFLRVGDLAIITAGWDSFKSFFALELAWSLATARPFLGRFGVEHPLRMGILQVEIDPGSYDERIKVFPPSKDLFTASALGWRFDQLGEVKEVMDDLHLDGMVFDPIGEMWPAVAANGEPFRETAKEQVTPIIHQLKAWGKTIILVHHDPKPSQGVKNRASGSAVLLNAPDTRILLDRVGATRRVKVAVRTRLQRSAGDIEVEFRGGRLAHIASRPATG